MSSTTIDVGDVLLLRSRFTNPPKDKFHVVVCVTPSIQAFLINTRMSPFVMARPKRQADYELVTVGDMPWLGQKRYIDVGDVFPIGPDELEELEQGPERRRTRIPPSVARRLLERVDASVSLSARNKRQIRAGLVSMLAG